MEQTMATLQTILYKNTKKNYLCLNMQEYAVKMQISQNLNHTCIFTLRCGITNTSINFINPLSNDP